MLSKVLSWFGVKMSQLDIFILIVMDNPKVDQLLTSMVNDLVETN